jgi:hypothetical protein
MFQGSLEPLYVYKNIEFVYACYKFTQVGRDMTKKAFLDFIRSRRREFPCLNEFLNMKGVT